MCSRCTTGKSSFKAPYHFRSLFSTLYLSFVLMLDLLLPSSSIHCCLNCYFPHEQIHGYQSHFYCVIVISTTVIVSNVLLLKLLDHRFCCYYHLCYTIALMLSLHCIVVKCLVRLQSAAIMILVVSLTDRQQFTVVVFVAASTQTSPHLNRLTKLD